MAEETKQDAVVEETSMDQGDNWGDTSAMSADELKALAMQQITEGELEVVVPESSDQPRDAQGRFLKKDEDTPEVKADAKPEVKAEEVEEDEEPEEFIVEEVIPSPSGGSNQVFRGRGATEAEAYKDLSRKLKSAQENATKKIHEQEGRLKVVAPKDNFKPKEYNAQEEFVISQEMMQNPTKAFQKMFKDMTGYEIGEFRSSVEAAKAVANSQAEATATQSFLTTHPDYEKSPRNGKLMVNWVRTQGDSGKSTEANLEDAYQDLKESGLLNLKSEVGSTDQPTTEAEPLRIAKTEDAGATQRTATTAKKSSSITQRNRPTAAPKADDNFEQKHKNLSLDELRNLAYQHADQF